MEKKTQMKDIESELKKKKNQLVFLIKLFKELFEASRIHSERIKTIPDIFESCLSKIPNNEAPYILYNILIETKCG